MEVKIEFQPIDFSIPTYKIQEEMVQQDSQESFIYSLLGINQDYTQLCKKNSSDSSENQETNITKNKEVKQSKSSSHHNFQKHTVTTLKCLISQQNFDEHFQDTSVMKKLWNIFLKNKSRRIQTKKFLTIFFNQKFCKDLKNYGFQKLFEQSQQSDIKDAQVKLKQLAYSVLNYKNITKHVQNRKLQRKQNFLHYLIQFRKELQTNEIRRRMNKNTSDKISQSSDVFSCLTFNF